MPVIAPKQEAKVGGPQIKAELGKCVRPYLKNKLKSKRLGVWPKW
jgi:hypothetical protein